MLSTGPADRSARIRLALEYPGIPNLSGDLAPEPPDHAEVTVCEPLVFPLPVAPSRIAIIDGRFSEAKNVRDFDPADIHGLACWKPEALVAPLEDALALAGTSLRLSTALVVLTSLGGVPLDDYRRDRLWDAFGVPVFEQLRSWRGAVIARECEAHAGLHIARGAAILHRDPEGEILLTLLHSKQSVLKSRTGLTGEIVESECECGSGIPRLRNLAAVSELALEPDAAEGD